MLGQHRFHEVVELFLDQIRGLVDGGSDVLIIETVQDILELKAAVHAALQVRARERHVRIPIHASITLDTSGRMLLGTDIAAALNILEHLPVDIVGLNCSTGPDYMREPARYLGEHATKPVAIIPNAGIPINVNGLAVVPAGAGTAGPRSARDGRASCRSASSAAAAAPPPSTSRRSSPSSSAARPIPVPPSRPARARPRPQIASMIRAIDLHQEPAPLIVGERVNTQGSRKVKRLALADDYDGLLNVGRLSDRGRRACPRRLRRPDRARRRARHDAQAGQEAGPQRRGAARDRLDRSRRDQGRPGAVPGPGNRQLDQHGERPRAHRGRDAAGSWPTAPP